MPASGRAAIAVRAALSKLGYPYVYGGKGPDVFDCSGFTSWAWRQAGVSLSSSSSAQANQGTRVSVSALRPGDILFYGSPVSHVAMYIGNGQVVHASNPGRRHDRSGDAGKGSRKPFARGHEARLIRAGFDQRRRRGVGAASGEEGKSHGR